MPDQNRTDPLRAEPLAPLGNVNLEQYLLHGRRQVRQLLQELIDGHALISAHPSPGKNSFLTALITLSDNDDWLFFDVSQDPVINRHCLQADQLICATEFEKIRIQFSLSRITEAQLEGRAAFAAPVPDTLLRLQRREYYRLHVPLAHGLVCRLPAEGEAPLRPRIEARVLDISAGGLALHLPSSDTGLSIGCTLQDCRLTLPLGEPLSVELEVRNISRQNGRNGSETLRIGCRFVDLPPTADTQIQRYIFRTERERCALERGGL
ncbi:MAG: flagellar brake protein [Betaproteobacteria bacterium HGW-Betaproteobacteria-21]|nr:MAG: flagellar brake protein [Betaproteobacteria bacterium HGW-Betaproteobacteria-21]